MGSAWDRCKSRCKSLSVTIKHNIQDFIKATQLKGDPSGRQVILYCNVWAIATLDWTTEKWINWLTHLGHRVSITRSCSLCYALLPVACKLHSDVYSYSSFSLL